MRLFFAFCCCYISNRIFFARSRLRVDADPDERRSRDERRAEPAGFGELADELPADR